jgi:uncharacterized protein (DUF305 family)
MHGTATKLHPGGRTMSGMTFVPVEVRLPPTTRRRPRLLYAATAALAAVLLGTAGYCVGASRSAPQTPGEGSVDVGFIRDMMVHHAQAVTLAMIVDRRATVPAVREMADDIAIGQEREIGVMAGWLQQWGLPDSTTAAPMAWMTHPPEAAPGADPPMPGMATRREVARLAVTRGRQADLLFCQLMLPHHLGALHMIDDVIARGGRPEVIELAEQMRTGQQKEINLLNRLLTELSTG